MSKKINKKTELTEKDISYIAGLSNIPVSKIEQNKLKDQLSKTLVEIEKLSELETKKVTTTAHVTGLENVTRKDKVIPQQQLSQKDALSNTKKAYNNLFQVPALFNLQ